MALDLAALKRASEGDPDAKVAVRKAWLAEVHAELLEFRRLKADRSVGDRIAHIGEQMMGMGIPR